MTGHDGIGHATGQHASGAPDGMSGNADEAAERFVRDHTALCHAPMVPEFALHLATEITPIWTATEAWLERTGTAPPFWAFAWPGGQALARLMLDRSSLLAGRRVLDFAAGCGIAAIAAARSGAASVEAADIDPLALAAIRLNARFAGASVTCTAGDVVGAPSRWDLILCGDVCYEAPMTGHILPWLRNLARDSEVWIADPGRAYLPRDGMREIARFQVPTTLELEDRATRETVIYRLG